MAVDLADEVRKRKVIDDLGMESSFDYDPITEEDQSQQSAPEQNFVLTPVEGMESPIPDFESVEDQPPEEARTFLNPATGSIERLQEQPPSQEVPFAAPNVALGAREIQPAASRAELVKLPPVPSVAAASREFDLAPAAEPVQRVERGQLVGLPPEQLPDDYTGDEETVTAPIATGPTPAPASQPSVPQAPVQPPSGQNYVLTPIDATTGQPIVQPAQPVTIAKTQEPATAPQSVESDLTEPARSGSYTPYQGSEPRRIQGIILHSSDGSLKSDINTLTGGDPSHKVSAHYYTAADGTVHHFVADNDIAYHAGATTGQYGYLNNGNTIGIEQEHVDGTPWKDAEIRGTAQTVADLLRRYPYLSINDVLGHSDIAPERKQDPLNFPWDKFRQYVAQDLGQQLAQAQAPVAQPGTKLPNGFYQNEDPKTFLRGPATTFATPEDVASGADPGVGSPKLGKLDTTQVAGVAVPQDVLQSQLGSNPAAWRKARVDVVDPQIGRRLRLPIVDVGPSNPNALFDMTPWVSNYFGGDKTLSVKLVPNAGPDVNKNPGSWADEQASIRQGFDSSALAPGAVKVQKPQNYQLVPVAPSAEGVALQQADQFAQQSQRDILTALPEAQGGQSIGALYNRLDKPVDGVNDAMRKNYQQSIKQIATAYAQDYYGIKDPAEAFKRITSDPNAGTFLGEIATKIPAQISSAVTAFNQASQTTDENRVNQFISALHPEAAPQARVKFLEDLINTAPEMRGPVINQMIAQLEKEQPGVSAAVDPGAVLDSLNRIADPEFQARREAEIKRQVDANMKALRPDPTLSPGAANVANIISQIPKAVIEGVTGPIGQSLLQSEIYQGTYERLKEEHPEMSEADLRDLAGRSSIAQLAGAEILTRVAAVGGLGGVTARIQNPLQRIASSALVHSGTGAGAMAAQQIGSNIAEGKEPLAGVGPAIGAGALMGVPGGIVGGIRKAPAEAQPPVPETPPLGPMREEAPAPPPAPPVEAAAQAGVPPVDPRFVARNPDATLVNVPASEVDTRWQSSPLNKAFYLEPGGEGENYIGDRYQQAQDYLASGNPMYAPEVTVRPDGSIHFSDGRHRFAAMRDSELEHVPLAMDAESLKNLQETRIAGMPELQAPVQGEAEPWVSKIANRFSSERVASGELGPIAPGQGVSTEEMLARGMKMGPEEINQHVSDLMQDKGNLATQAAAVRAEEARLSQRSNAASRAAEADPANQQLKTQADDAFKDLTDFHNGPVAKLKNDWHKAGKGMQGEIPVDLSTYNGLREAYLKNLGKAPDPKMEPVLRKTAKAVSDATAAETAAMQKLGAEIEKQARGKTLPTDDQVRARLMEIMKDPCYT